MTRIETALKTVTKNQKKTRTKNNKTFNVCYLREYMDPEHQGDFFYHYETVYRNVPEKFRKKFKSQKTKMKIIKFLDWNYKESASNFANSTRIELIDEDHYYKTYERCVARCGCW